MANLATKFFLGRFNPTNVYRYLFIDRSFRGYFDSYEAALRLCGEGIASPDYADRAVWNTKECTSDILTANETGVLLCLASRPRRVLDIGGGNGNFYRLATEYLAGYAPDWTILETPAVVSGARSSVPHYTDDWNVLGDDFDFVLINNVLHILPEPLTLAERLSAFEQVLIGGVPLSNRAQITITAQPLLRRKRSIRFPVHIFASEFLALFSGNHRTSARWLSGNTARVGLRTFERQSFLFERRP